MTKPGKNYRNALAKVNIDKQYPPREGVALAKAIRQHDHIAHLLISLAGI